MRLLSLLCFHYFFIIAIYNLRAGRKNGTFDRTTTGHRLQPETPGPSSAREYRKGKSKNMLNEKVSTSSTSSVHATHGLCLSN